MSSVFQCFTFRMSSTAWQSLPEYGVSLFVVKFMGQRKEELLGVAFNRLMRMEMTTGDHIKTWRYNTMKVSSLFLLFLFFVCKSSVYYVL